MADSANDHALRLVLIESPLSGDVPRNIRYARACMRDALMHGDAPFLSHLLYAQKGVLDDLKPDERALGIAAGFAWGRVAEATVVYTDLGISAGMKLGIRDAEDAKRPVEYRTLGAEWNKPTPKPVRWGRGIDQVWHRWLPAPVGVFGTVCELKVSDYGGAWDPADNPPLGSRICAACSAWRSPSAATEAA